VTTDQLKGLIKNSFLWVVVAFLFVFIRYLDFSKPILDFFGKAMIPVQKRAENIDKQVSEWIYTFSHIEELKNENAELKDQIFELQSRLNELEGFRRENASLREQCGVEEKRDINYILAEVVSLDRDVKGIASLKVDKGKNDGVKSGAVVLYKKNILIGRITDVDKYSSHVEMVTSFPSRIGVLVKSVGGDARGIVTGQTGEFLVIENVDRNRTIKEGEEVITSGEDDIFPRGFLIGVVDHSEADPTSSFQTVYLKALFDPLNLKYVLIVKDE